jgi:alpha-1,6-mannosyltransferase
MHVVDVCESYSPHGGGVRTYVHAKLRAAAARGHEITVIAPGTKDDEQRLPGGRILTLRSPRSPFDARYGVFVSSAPAHSVITALNPDIVEGSSPWIGGRIAATVPSDVPRVLVYHTDPIAVWAQTMLSPALAFRTVDRAFTPAWRMLQQLSARYDATVVSGGWLAERLLAHGFRRPLVVPFGVDKTRFLAARRDEEVRRQWLERCGLPPTAALVGVVGRLDPEKRIGMLIEAFAKARRHRPMGLVVFGRGALRSWYARLAGRVDNVHMAGYVDGPDAMACSLASCDALLHGGAAETYGMAVAEAICARVPVVVPDVGGASALYNPSCAERYPAGDSTAAGAALLRLLARDPEALRRACEVQAKAIPTLDQHFGRLFETYAQLERKPQPEAPLRAVS